MGSATNSCRRSNGRAEGKIERRAMVGCAFSPDPSSVTTNDGLRNRQAHAQPRIIRNRVQSLEGLEQFRCRVRHIKPSAIVAYQKNAFAVDLLLSDFDRRG